MPVAASVLILVVAGIGCGGAQDALSRQAQIVQATRPSRLAFYELLHRHCLEEASLPAYDLCMAPASHVSRAADSYREALEAAQASLRLTGGFEMSALLEAAQHLARSLADAGVDLPPEVSAILEGLSR